MDAHIGVRIVDFAVVLSHQTAGDRAAFTRVDAALGAAHRDRTFVASCKAAGDRPACERSFKRAAVDCIFDREACLRICLAVVPADQAARLRFACDAACHMDVADQSCNIAGHTVFAERYLRPAHNCAHKRTARDCGVLKRQILDRAAPNHAEQADILLARPVDGEVRDRFAVSVKRAGKGRAPAADAGKFRALQINILRQPVIGGERFCILTCRQRAQLAFGRNFRPIAGACVQLLYPRRTEMVLGHTLVPQNRIAVNDRSRRHADIGKHVVDRKHPAVRRKQLAAVDGAHVPAEIRRFIAVGELFLLHGLVHHIAHARVAV